MNLGKILVFRSCNVMDNDIKQQIIKILRDVDLILICSNCLNKKQIEKSIDMICTWVTNYVKVDPYRSYFLCNYVEDNYDIWRYDDIVHNKTKFMAYIINCLCQENKKNYKIPKIIWNEMLKYCK